MNLEEALNQHKGGLEDEISFSISLPAYVASAILGSYRPIVGDTTPIVKIVNEHISEAIIEWASQADILTDEEE